MKKIFTIIICICAITAQAQKAGNEAIRKLQMAEFAIANLYVDSVDENKLVEEAIIKMLAQLDPHSTYNDAEEVKKMNEPLQGNFEGIGVQFQMIEDTLLVVQPVSNGPSEKVGILAGDRIIAVNDSAIAGVKMSTEEIMSRLRGAKGSEVKLTIVRRGVNEPLYFTVKRDKIPILSLDASYMIQPQTGYIRINRFGATTPEEFLKALKQLQKKGMKDLILDLQGNGGGYLNAAIDLANEFLQQKDLIVYTEGRAARRSNFYAKGNGNFKDGRLIVLVDEYSASASEIVTGAIQDWDRGVIVGRRTFGKGLVQRPIDLPDGSMIRLTIARYYTPSGRCIQKPYDKTANLDGKLNGEDTLEKYNQELIDRFNHGELMHADSIHFPDSLKYQTKKLARTVYGGGGIMPDVFVPQDTTGVSSYLIEVSNRGLIIQFSFQYTDRNRAKLSTFENEQDLLKYLRRQGIVEQFIRFADSKGVKRRNLLIHRSYKLLERNLYGNIIYNTLGKEAYIRYINESDATVKKALEILERGEAFPKAPLQAGQEEENTNGKEKRTAQAYGFTEDPSQIYHYASVTIC